MRNLRRKGRARRLAPPGQALGLDAAKRALVPPPRYPLTRFHGVLAPRAKLRPRVVPKLPEGVRAGGTCGAAGASRKTRDKVHDAPAERPPPRDRRGPVVPVGVAVSATMLARTLDGADVPAPNVLSAKHLGRIGGGLLFAATSNVPWPTLLARTFDIDVKVCARCGARLDVRAVVVDHDVARRILDAIPTTARAPPSRGTSVASEPAFA